jgi:hypothetical protein
MLHLYTYGYTYRMSQFTVYKLVSNASPFYYIGSTTRSLKQRLCEHRYKSKLHPDQRVYRHFNEIGWNSVSILEISNANDVDDMRRIEDVLIRCNMSNKHLLNTKVGIETALQRLQKDRIRLNRIVECPYCLNEYKYDTLKRNHRKQCYTMFVFRNLPFAI